jgi:hypothetical protein
VIAPLWWYGLAETPDGRFFVSRPVRAADALGATLKLLEQLRSSRMPRAEEAELEVRGLVSGFGEVDVLSALLACMDQRLGPDTEPVLVWDVASKLEGPAYAFEDVERELGAARDRGDIEVTCDPGLLTLPLGASALGGTWIRSRVRLRRAAERRDRRGQA